jgi:hypothetical protein
LPDEAIEEMIRQFWDAGQNAGRSLEESTIDILDLSAPPQPEPVDTESEDGRLDVILEEVNRGMMLGLPTDEADLTGKLHGEA